jgi:predicted flap endonuclease-1-like 5' DNA nuclease
VQGVVRISKEFQKRRLVMAKLEQIEGIGKTFAKKLRKADIRSTDALLEKGSTPQGRKDLAEKTGIGKQLILEWVNHVDLFRIKGVGEEYADLLEEAGVDTVVELGQRNAKNLFEKLVSTNKKKKLVRKMPTQDQVANWIAQAKKLPRRVNY